MIYKDGIMIVCTEASGAASIRAEAAPFFSFSGVKDGIKNVGYGMQCNIACDITGNATFQR
ncbi:MAG: hypothetical protein HFI92_04720 [Lachnospiraceae bacterium]|nr:hypothetical protein [Lachnospiraceae bacterium]